MFLPHRILEERLLEMLAEDLGQGDITTALTVPTQTLAEAEIIAKEQGIAAGIEEAQVLLASLGLEFNSLVTDGENIRAKQPLLHISGDARTILSAERTLLNLLTRMSGIATATHDLIKKLQSAKVKTRIACTRKTAPGLLYFDKKAVLVGGGDTHRLHLDDMILIKDNHIAIAGNVEKAIEKAKMQASLTKKIEIEVTKVEDVLVAAEAGADVILLDNLSPKQVKKAVELLRKRKLCNKVLLEASGGITGENVLDYASTGIDLVSLGEITHSARALNMSLEIVKTKKM